MFVKEMKNVQHMINIVLYTFYIFYTCLIIFKYMTNILFIHIVYFLYKFLYAWKLFSYTLWTFLKCLIKKIHILD